MREHAHAVLDAQGQVRYFEETVEDITAERAQQAALHAHRDQLEQMVQIIPAVVYRLLLHPSGQRKVSFVSQQRETIFGIAPQQVLADPGLVNRMRHPEDADRVAAAVERAVRDGTPLHIEYRLCLPSGDMRTVQLLSASMAPDGDWAVRVGMLFDVTERRRVEEALRTSGEVWKRALMSMGDAVWDWHVQDSAKYLSPAGKTLLGYAPDELADTPQALDAVVHPEDRAQVQADRRLHLGGHADRLVASTAGRHAAHRARPRCCG